MLRLNQRNGNKGGTGHRINIASSLRAVGWLTSLIFSYYYGVLNGALSEKQAPEGSANAVPVTNEIGTYNAEKPLCFNQDDLNNIINEKVAEQVEKMTGNSASHNSEVRNDVNSEFNGLDSMKSWIQNWARIPKGEYLDTFDYGTPRDHNGDNGEVLLMYHGNQALPRSMNASGKIASASEATENCKELNTIILEASSSSCTALLLGYPSYQLQRWMKDVKGKKIKKLEHVGRGLQTNGMDKFAAPNQGATEENWERLLRYLSSMDELKKNLKPMLEKIARDNSIVVAVCNLGQASLLMNFVCNARSKGFDISNLLVFATDQETLTLCQSMDLNCYYDGINFADLPTREARAYGDRIFSQMMWAKVIVVQFVNWMGYDVLFQDVDVVWYKDPITLLKDGDDYKGFDIMFQDDGARSLRYAPYCANSGFYYVRYNDRTRYLFQSLLYAGDFISKTGSHQQALTALLAEHSSLTGLKVKTLDTHEFPGGWNFHRRSNKTIKEMVGHPSVSTDKHIPTIFHMSWTKNKVRLLISLVHQSF